MLSALSTSSWPSSHLHNSCDFSPSPAPTDTHFHFVPSPNLRATFSLLEHPRHVLPFQASEVLAALAADKPLPNSPVRFRSQSDPAGTGAPHGRPIHEADLTLLEGIMTRRERWNWEGGCRAKPEVVDNPEDQDQESDSRVF